MEDFSFHYKDKKGFNNFSKILKSIINKDTVIINVGSSYNIGDSIAPMLGSMIESAKLKIDVYGDLNTTINTDEKIKLVNDYIKKTYDNPIIIAIDACVGNKKQIGEIHFKKEPLFAGSGVGKTLSQIGDYSIQIVVDKRNKNINNRFKDINLSLIWDLSATLYNAFEKSLK